MRAAYERDETDEFIDADAGRRRGADPARATACCAFNFRPDRMREITRALADPSFDEIDRGGAAPVARYATPDRVRGGVALSGRLPAGAARRRRWPR